MNTWKRSLSGLAVTMAFAGGASAAELANDYQKFLRTAAESSMFEIEASKLAAQKAQHPDVKAFAKIMVDDHAKVGAELKSLAKSKNFALPTALTGYRKDTLASLNKKSGHDFDDEYAEEVAVDAHQDAVDAFKDASKDAKDADIKAFAAKTLPALEAHLAKCKILDKAVDYSSDRKNAPSAGVTK